MNKVNWKAVLLALIPVAIGLLLMLVVSRCESDKDKEIRQLKYELAHASQYLPLERDTVVLHHRDTVRVTTVKVIEGDRDDLVRQHLIDREVIDALNVKVKELEALHTTVTQTLDSARAAYSHNSKVFSYLDEWSHLQFRLQDSTFLWKFRDSLSFVVYREYKHRFLWWRWGTKGYRVTTFNHNPHSTVTYSRYVRPE